MDGTSTRVENFFMKTDTELFKETVEWFAGRPERRATTPEGRCRYRTEDGRRCAVGQLIPKRKYRTEFEGCNIQMKDEEPHSTQKALLAALPKGINLNLLYWLQQWHDSPASFSSISWAMANLTNALNNCVTGPDISVFIGTFEND